MSTTYKPGQPVTIDIWCCGPMTPATVCSSGPFCVTVDCLACGKKHTVQREQVALVPGLRVRINRNLLRFGGLCSPFLEVEPIQDRDSLTYAPDKTDMPGGYVPGEELSYNGLPRQPIEAHYPPMTITEIHEEGCA